MKEKLIYKFEGLPGMLKGTASGSENNNTQNFIVIE